ncbi:hypothetical protein J2Y69_000903 [Microbacterium resistens]|uniref:Uncharacterized protein n=1 Tax=Microbacterium resistens TaxID=156977 RepID=A0ABU1S9M3_9MICO|nr:hypothetical protein [Microbacterium resistens]MDR6866311.1 hypothetical protein [Microbacterium resistens]
MDRYRLPRWANAAIDWIADHPNSVAGRLAALRIGRPGPRGSVPATTFEDRPIRVLIAPVNYSGQAREWARALEAADPSVSARNMAMDVPGGFSFDADVVVPVATFHNDRDWQRREFEAAAGATHVLIEAEEPPFGRMLGRSVQAQAEALLRRGVDVAYLAHGTDVRLPSRHRQDHPWSHFSDESIYAPRLEVVAARNIALLEASGRPLFVSTPDLLADVPEAAWCPVVVDPRRWHVDRTERPAGRPLRVAHAPSVSAVKGTELILPILTELVDEGIIEFELIQGVPSARMPEAFARADVVIDQLRIGSYGVAACEAMAAGAVVVGHVTAPIRTMIGERVGRELPILEATVDTIEAVLRDLAARADLPSLRDEGRAFVEDVHDGRLAATVLRTQWIDRGHGLEDGKGTPR